MDKRVTIKDVAKAAGVSPATISYVLSGKANISDETRKRVTDAVESLGYVPNLSARALVNNDSKLIGVVIPQTEPGSKLLLNNAFYSEIISSIEYEARLLGYQIIISGMDANESYFKTALQRNLDGVIVIGAYSKDFYQDVKKTNMPIVTIDSYMEDHYFHSVTINDQYGGYVATKYLIEKGHRSIALFTGIIKEGGVVKKRFDGYADALKEFGIELDKACVFQSGIDFKAGQEMAQRFAKLQKKPTAIFCTADIVAMGAIKALHSLGIHVPEDVSIIGFDNLSISSYTVPGLTTVQQDISMKGKIAVKFLIESVADRSTPKQEEILPIHIVERESVRQI